jgi:ribosomal protein S18 acetylase RimI-like enzyme
VNRTIRLAVSSDMESVGRLGAMLVKAHHDFDQKRFIPPTEGTPAGYASFLRSQLSNEKVIILVAEIDGAVAGYSYAGIEGTDWMSLRGPAGVIYDILVDPEYRRQGVGMQLLEATIEVLKSRNTRQIVLSTADRNEEAQRLFERAGFRRTMIEMTKDL